MNPELWKAYDAGYRQARRDLRRRVALVAMFASLAIGIGTIVWNAVAS